MEQNQKTSIDGTQEKVHKIPGTLAELLSVVMAQGRLDKFIEALSIIDKNIQDPEAKKAALEDLARKITNDIPFT